MGFDIDKMSKTKASEKAKIVNEKKLENKYKFTLITKEEIETEKIRGYQYAV